MTTPEEKLNRLQVALYYAEENKIFNNFVYKDNIVKENGDARIKELQRQIEKLRSEHPEIFV